MVSSGTVLEARDLWVAYPGARQPVLRGVSIAVPTGAQMAIVGPNGGGKSTLLKAALGLVKPVRGGIQLLNGTPLAEARARVGYVPQTEVVDWRFPVSV